jgi:DNA-binding response OmpR family regulator
MSDKKILVVDDEPHLVRSLTFILEKAGYIVSSASNGEEALSKISQSKPNLIFLDVMMPKKNGYEVCEEIKKSPELKDIYCIILTAKGQETDREQGLKAGADEFITKPFSPLEIVARVKKILE